MSNIKKLLEGVEVEWKTLGEITNILRGKRLTRNLLSANDKYPVFHGGLDPLGYYYNANRPADTVMIINVGASAGTVGYSSVDFWSSDGTYCIEQMAKLNNKFLYYFLLGEQYYLKSRVRVAGIPTLDAFVIEKLQIPIPYPNNLKKSLEIQQEIVRILDSFSMLTAELQAELQARKEQYEYYRNKLLMFDKIGGGTQSVTWLKMSEIGTFIRGKRFVRTDIVSNGVPCIHYGDMYTYYGLYATQSKGRLRSELASKMRYAQKNDVVIVAAGENKEDIGVGLAWLGDEPAAVHDACFIFRSDLYPQYVSHYLRSNYYHKQIVKYVSEGKICSISAKGLGNAIIPIPAHEEQVRIATLLNNFDALVGDLTKGIPAEMVAVQEQYEYYRNKLLSFPRIQISA